jgi:hypothetical protein
MSTPFAAKPPELYLRHTSKVLVLVIPVKYVTYRCLAGTKWSTELLRLGLPGLPRHRLREAKFTILRKMVDTSVTHWLPMASNCAH